MTQYPPPGQPPHQPLNYATPTTGPRTDLREIAARQRNLMYCILAYILLIVSQFVLPRDLGMFIAGAALIVSITAVVFVFMLSIALYNTGVGVLLGVLTLIPLLGLVVLLVVNGKATAVLRQHGVRVGFLGADPNQVPGAPPAPPPYQP